ncbi:DUF732 domain-containing protein [Mycolicibacterium poriferae]|uniref:DUF732 domain-containing protein n=1 Tax=Mycolicibacterium poriferae TaxID=39694 RepID=UPI0024B94474|nr:DUF732 domain-containing protein [Mycolicibacterium poriferae]
MQNASRRSGIAGLAGFSLLAASAAAGLSGCSMTDDMVMGLGSQTEAAQSESPAAVPGPDDLGADDHTLVVTQAQRHYLDALHGAGVQPSSDLAALRIGSYVCQARFAKHTDQQVWDFVLPLVRNEVGSSATAMTPSAGEVNTLTDDYIRIATEQLC